jgi:hypothetical protein
MAMRWRGALSVATTVLLAVMACHGRTAPAPAADPVIKFWGYVLTKDSLPAAGARVFTEPASIGVTTDTAGYWAIDVSLVPGEYRVRAELAGDQGRAQRIPAKLGETTGRIVILLGADFDVWPPVGIDSLLHEVTRGPAKMRSPAR